MYLTDRKDTTLLRLFVDSIYHSSKEKFSDSIDDTMDYLISVPIRIKIEDRISFDILFRLINSINSVLLDSK
jgi:hypothetical protein